MKLEYNERSGDVELSFAVVSVRDGGRYMCHASNEHGLASSVTDLVVKSKCNSKLLCSKHQIGSLNIRGLCQKS